MKRISVLTIGTLALLGFVLGTATHARSEENNDDLVVKDSVFQKMADVINGKYEVKAVPYKKIEAFQIASDEIRDGSVRAKKLSLRTK